MLTAAWKKSSRSAGGTYCVEARTDTRVDGGAGVQVRDSKDPHGPVLSFTGTGWHAFTRAVRAGAF